MDSAWQLAIGSLIVGLFLALLSVYRSYLRECKEHNENQFLAKTSILFGLSGIILVGIGSLLGIVIGLVSTRGKQYKALSKIGIVISVLTMIPWILVFVFGC